MVAAEEALRRLIQRVREDQDPEGTWIGELRSGMNSFYYAASLALAGEPSASPVIQDICDFTEQCAAPGGGIGIYPGEPADGMSSFNATLLLRWARPRSPALAPAAAWLERERQAPPTMPLLYVSRLALDPAARAWIVSDPGPPAALRRIAQATWPNVWRYFSYRKLFAQPYKAPSRAFDVVVGPLLQWMFWPDHERAHALPWVMPPHMNLAILPAYAALRRLAGDRSPDVVRLADFTLQYMADHRYDDGSVLYLNFLPSYLLCAAAFERPEERALLEAGLRRIRYRTGSWLRGTAVAINVLDTAMTLQALRSAGVAANDPAIERAAAFLRSAQSEEGMWSWGYERAMGRRFRTGDTDDTGAACMALAAAGVPPEDPALRTGLSALRRLQTSSGGVDTFSIGPAANTVAISNTSRTLQAMRAAGLEPDHPAIRRGCAWLLGEQDPDGKWVDYWIARWIYGTVMAVEALVKTGHLAPGATPLERAMCWLIRQQNADGGWGEDWRGTRSGSTVEHTAMALYGLCLGSRSDSRPLAAMGRGVRWLLDRQRPDGGFAAAYVGAYSLMEGYASTQIPHYWALLGLSEYLRLTATPETRVVRLRERKERRPATPAAG